MGNYPLNRYVPGTYKRECDICGFDKLRNEMRKNWKGLIVCPPCWDPKPEELIIKPHRSEKPFKRD